jgi:hypothetical protein
MQQLEMFMDYDMEGQETKLRLLSDMRDVCHASQQGLYAIVGAMSKLQVPVIDLEDIHEVNTVLTALNEECERQIKLVIEEMCKHG